MNSVYCENPKRQYNIKYYLPAIPGVKDPQYANVKLDIDIIYLPTQKTKKYILLWQDWLLIHKNKSERRMTASVLKQDPKT